MRVRLALVCSLACLFPTAVSAVDDFDFQGTAPPGTSGADANAQAISSDPTNWARAAGGHARGPTDAAPEGLNGGSASATAVTDAAGDASARAEAFGGRPVRPFSDDAKGGSGGAADATAELRSTGGDGNVEALAVAERGADRPFGTAPGISGGQGGTATASATGSTTAGDLAVKATATAGSSGASAFPADGADARATATGSLEADAGASLDVDATAGAGSGGDFSGVPGEAGRSGAGGDAVADADGTAVGTAAVSVSALAFAGSAGRAQGNGGTSTAQDTENDGGEAGNADASARASGGGAVDVSATAVGGAGGGAAEARSAGATLRSSQMGGTPAANAYGASTGGGPVHVEVRATGGRGGSGLAGASGGSGADATLIDAVSGETTGVLDLVQTAQGGAGGDASNSTGGRLAVAGAGGDAHSAIDGVNPLAGALRVEVEAIGGGGGRATGAGIGGDGGAATLLATGTSSNGADVVVVGTARGGRGGEGASGGAGADVALDDHVRGTTTGALRLEQHAFAGGGGNGSAIFGSGDASGIQSGAADGGTARSRLTHQADSADLALDASATGGIGGSANGSARAGRGGDAVVEVRGANATGAAAANATAQGGNGGLGSSVGPNGPTPPADGGDATAIAEVETAGDGHGVSVDARADGGAGRGGTAEGSSGGDATARAVGRAAGNGAVVATSRASAGIRGSGSAGAPDGVDGSADAYAEASNAGDQAVVAFAQAFRGIASAHASSTGGGDATARAWSSSASGPVVVRDLVSGSTAGLLLLEQRATAGTGDAVVELTAENTGGGDLRVDLIASGGADVVPGEARLGRLDLRSQTGAAIDAHVALAGAIGRQGGASTPTGPGGSVVVDDANALVSFDTAGTAALEIDAVAGEGGRSSSAGGQGGEARVALHDVRTSARQLSLDIDARAGRGGAGQVTSATGGAGGRAEVDLALASSTGSIDVALSAQGGFGGTPGNGAVGGDGGDAVVDVEVTTSGDGADIFVGDTSIFSAFGSDFDVLPSGGARAGPAGGSRAPDAAARNGGHATSSTRAVADGDATVRVVDVARGGSGGFQLFGAPVTADGGRGGDATSSAIGINHGASPVDVFASAVGSSGGNTSASGTTPANGGDGGTATLGPVYGASHGGGDVRVIGLVGGGVGGAGRNGTVGRGQAVHLFNAVDGYTSGSLTLEQAAASGREGSQGLDASSRLDKNVDNRSLTLVTYALGNGNGPTGGGALAQSVARNQTGDASARARAEAGRVLQHQFGARDATASALAESFGEGRVEVVAESIGGESYARLGGAGLLGEVRGISHRGGDVEVTGISRAGAGAGAADGSARAADLVNAVSGSTSGALSLRQVAEGGRADEAELPVGGRASSALDVDGSDASASLSLVAESIGGNGGESYDPAMMAAGGDAAAAANSVNRTGEAHATAIARGGETGNGIGGAARARATALAHGNASAWAEVEAGGVRDGSSGVGAAVIEALRAESLSGGDVDVVAILRGASRGAERDVFLADAPDGATTGALSLRQTVYGGVRLAARSEGGAATSSLHRDETLASSLVLRSQAIASANTEFFPTDPGGNAAVSTISGGTSSGSALVLGLASGSDALGTDGGAAQVDAAFETNSVSGDVVIGVRGLDLAAVMALAPDAREFGAFGGNAGGGFDGGSAVSRSMGRAFGDSAATVSDLAVGGRGGGPTSTICDRCPGDGGAASSTAIAEAVGKDVTRSSARAVGGDGGFSGFPSFFLPNPASVGGDADATATAIGGGRVDATAWASAGRSRGELGAAADARANAVGERGEVAATAETSAYLIQRIALSASSEVAGSASVGAASGVRFAPSVSSGHDAAIAGRALVRGEEQVAFEARRPGLAAQMAELGLDTIVADVALEMSPGEGAGARLTSTIDIAFDLADSRELTDLHLFLLDGDATGDADAFGQVVLRVLRADSVLVERSMRTLEGVGSLFSDETVALGGGFDGVAAFGQPGFGEALRVELTWLSKRSGWSFGGTVVVAAANTPEPGTGALVSLGLAILGLRHRRPARTRRTRVREAARC